MTFEPSSRERAWRQLGRFVLLMAEIVALNVAMSTGRWLAAVFVAWVLFETLTGGTVAQWIERGFSKPRVGGSSPPGPTRGKHASVPPAVGK